MSKELVPIEVIENRILLIRSKKVMLDRDLAQLYGVSTKVLNQATKRNAERFPEDFMFQLTREEAIRLKCNLGISILRSQIVTLKQGEHYKYMPYAFTEQGIAMLSSVLRSRQAIQVNIIIMRAFVRMRQMLANNKELSKKMELLEKRVLKHDSDIRELVRDIRMLTIEKTGSKERIGFLR